jgi:M6 family metalloprotease-like protein
MADVVWRKAPSYPVGMSKPMRLIPLILSIVLIATAAQAATAPKAGSACKKAGQTITASGKKFTCVKSGKKLVWNKGVAVAAAKPTLPATPTPIATPMPSGTPTAKAIEGQSCTAKGLRESHIGGYLECRPIAQQKMVWFKLSDSPVYPLQQNKFEETSECKISNTNESKEIGWHLSSSFPLFERNLPAKGIVKVAIVGVDFSDAKGDGLPSDIATNQMNKVNKFFKQYSNGKLSYEFIFINKWIRMPEPLTAYKMHGPEGATRTWPEDLGLNLIKDIYKVSDPEYNFTDVKSILVVTPRNTPVFYHSALIQYFYNPNLISTASLTTNEGLIRNVFVGGGFDYAGNNEEMLWALWIHESVHFHGIYGHAQNNGNSTLGVMSNQHGNNPVLLSWDAFLLEWLTPQQLACIPIKSLVDERFTLSPIERDENGLKSVMVNISKNENLVIESRRMEGVSAQDEKGTYGLVIYTVNTNGYRDYLKLLKVDGASHGFAPALYKLNAQQTDLNDYVFEGESITYKGVTVKLVSSGDYDTIQISKN